MKSGIYKITNLENNKIYIGQSIDVKTRFGKHKSYLRYNKHHNEHLQRAFNKYGEESFSFEVIEYVDIDRLDEREIFFINYYDSMNIEKGYNLEAGGNTNKIVSEQAREKKRGANNPMYGRKQSEETRMRRVVSSRGKNSKLTEDDVVKIKELLIKGELNRREIGELFNVKHFTISKIATFVNWGYLRPDLNEKIVQAEKEREEIKRNSIISLYEKGLSIRAIELETKIDRRYISKVIETIPSRAD